MFEEGKECELMYGEMLNPYSRLCERLGVKNEDADVEVIIHSLMNICDNLCCRMYEYGAEFGMPKP